MSFSPPFSIELSSLSGDASELDTTHKNVAHAIINGDNQLGDKRPLTAPDTVSAKQEKTKAFQDIKKAVKCACDEAKKGTDPTGGATKFNLRPNDSQKPFQGAKIKTHNGPFNNSYPSKDLPKDDKVYVNTYKFDKKRLHLPPVLRDEYH